MKILIACEISGVVRDAFRARGVDAWSCDILPSESLFHIQADVLSIISHPWAAVIAFPPCDHLAISGARWFPEKIADGRQQAGVEFFMKLALCEAPLVAIENPVGIMSRLYRKPDQIICPTMFGHPMPKRTCLWLKGFPPLVPTQIVEGEYVVMPNGKRQPKWYYENSMRKATRKSERSRTFSGIAEAMANQWCPLLPRSISLSEQNETV